MSQIVARFRFDEEADIIWTICGIICFWILIITLYIFVTVIQHLHCIPDRAQHSKFQPKHIKTYSTLTVTFAALSSIVTLSIYPVCTRWSCGPTVIGSIYAILNWSLFFFSKSILHLIFIGRLFNPQCARIYQYPKCIEYLLRALWIILLIVMIGFNIDGALILAGFSTSDTIEVICGILYGITDIVLSITTMLLCFRPICMRTARNTASARRYGCFSAVQLTGAVLFQCTFLGMIYLTAMEYSINARKEYLYVSRVIQMLVH